MKIKLNDESWRIIRRSRAKGAERCDGITQYSSKTIYIDPKITGRNFVETIIHEILHAELPDLSEEAVSGIAKDLEVVLWKFKIRVPTSPSPTSS